MSVLTEGTSAARPALLWMSGICKSLGTQRVLHDVRFELDAGEVHVLIGENEAGKSTLIKLLGGVYVADAGPIGIHGRPYHQMPRPNRPGEMARARGMR